MKHIPFQRHVPIVKPEEYFFPELQGLVYLRYKRKESIMVMCCHRGWAIVQLHPLALHKNLNSISRTVLLALQSLICNSGNEGTWTLNDPEPDGFCFCEIPSGLSSHLTHAVAIENGKLRWKGGTVRDRLRCQGPAPRSLNKEGGCRLGVRDWGGGETESARLVEQCVSGSWTHTRHVLICSC